MLKYCKNNYPYLNIVKLGYIRFIINNIGELFVIL